MSKNCRLVNGRLYTTQKLWHDVATWVIHRRAAFQFLLRDAARDSSSKDLTKAELDMLKDVACPSSANYGRFWATLYTVQVLSRWGTHVSAWFHECKCTWHSSEKEKKNCSMKGRCAIHMASGHWKKHLSELEELQLSKEDISQLLELRRSGHDDDVAAAEQVQISFETCKRAMVFRCMQAWSFWGELPHAALSMAEHLVDPICWEDRSRNLAAQLLAQYDQTESKRRLGVVSWLFFEKYRSEIRTWISGSDLSANVVKTLLEYGSALCVMQRLEQKRHLVNLKLGRGRASTPAAVISGLRRSRNSDLSLAEFRQALPNLMDRFGELVPETWRSRKELIEKVYGYALDDPQTCSTQFS